MFGSLARRWATRVEHTEPTVRDSVIAGFAGFLCFWSCSVWDLLLFTNWELYLTLAHVHTLHCVDFPVFYSSFIPFFSHLHLFFNWSFIQSGFHFTISPSLSWLLAASPSLPLPQHILSFPALCFWLLPRIHPLTRSLSPPSLPFLSLPLF